MVLCVAARMTSSVADDLRHRHLLTRKQTHMIRSPEARIQVFEVNWRGWLSPVARYRFLVGLGGRLITQVPIN